MVSPPTGPHAPISNLVQEMEETSEEIVAPTEGSAGGEKVDAGKMEAAAMSFVAESTPEKIAPEAALPDIGTASFPDPAIVLETVHGVDNRELVQNTEVSPYRENASLLITARDGSQWIGTAWFISARTLITAGHCVYIKNSPVPNRDGWVKSIQVMPGRNGSKLPFGSVTSSEFWTVRGWAESGDENYDYGAIIIPTPLGDTVGKFGFANLADSSLSAAIAWVTGYPGDKPSGQMFTDTKAIASVTPSKVHYDIDTAGGQSGAAVYIAHQGKLVAVAVHAYGGPTTNSGTRISAPVFANLTSWRK